MRGSQMPRFGDLGDDQIWRLVAYIRVSGARSSRGRARRTTAAAATPPTVRRRDDEGWPGDPRRAAERGHVHPAARRRVGPAAFCSTSPRSHVPRRDRPNAAAPRSVPMLRRRAGQRGVTFDRLVNAAAEPHNWLMYWGDYPGHALLRPEPDRPAQRSRRCRSAWTFPMPGDSVLEATPLVVDGVMYTTQPGVVVALDARTGRQIWRYTRQQKQRNPHEINPFNRGVAILGSPAVRRHARRRARGARRHAPGCRSGRRRWPTRCSATASRARRWSSRDKVHRRHHRRRVRRARISSTPTMPRPASGCGAGTPCPGPASLATTPGSATAGSRAAARCG